MEALFLYFGLVALTAAPFYFSSLLQSVISLPVLIVLTTLVKYRARKHHWWIHLIQISCSLGIAAKLYQQYGLLLSVISLLIGAFFWWLTAAGLQKEEALSPQQRSDLPDLSTLAESPIQLEIPVTDRLTNDHFFRSSCSFRNGYIVNVSHLSTNQYKQRAAWNHALLKKLHKETEEYSQLAGALVSKEDYPLLFPDSLYAFFDTNRNVKGLQSGDLSIVFEGENFSCIQVIEYTCRNSEWYELALETNAHRIFLEKLLSEHNQSTIHIYQLAIDLSIAWQIPLKNSYVNMN